MPTTDSEVFILNSVSYAAAVMAAYARSEKQRRLRVLKRDRLPIPASANSFHLFSLNRSELEAAPKKLIRFFIRKFLIRLREFAEPKVIQE